MIDKKELIAKTLADWHARDAVLAMPYKLVGRIPTLADAHPEEEEPTSVKPRTFVEEALAEGMLDDRHHLTVEEYSQNFPQDWVEEWASREVEQSDWKPLDVRDSEKDMDFREFILSLIPRFDRLGQFKGFFLYLTQARRWYEETMDLDITLMDETEADIFARREYGRMRQNKLYALNRYVRIRDDQYPQGRPYWAGAPQALLCFLVDRGNSVVLLKGRQAAITSTMLAIAVINMLMQKDYTAVLLTDDKKKTGEDILAKKVQGTFQLLPEWITQNVVDALWAKENVTFDFELSDTKMDKRRNSSDFLLMSADDAQAVNSKTPTITLYDEVQNIATYGTIKREVKPTQLSRMPDGSMRLVRQQAAWGTGSSTDKGKGVFETDWKDTYGAVKNGSATGGWVPLFFDWTCRPGITAKDYLREKEEELQKSDTDGETALAIFNSHYPNSPEDSFMKSGGGIFPAIVIKRHRDELVKMPEAIRPVWGTFRALYDEGRKITALNSDHPYYIDKVEFVEARSAEALMKAPVKMFMRADNSYVGRYRQGTDPIQSSTGRSKFASAVWDRFGMEAAGCCGTHEKHLHPTVACVLNGRTMDPKEMYTQSVLMSMYYHDYGERACRELVEGNQGQNYIEYKQQEWVDQSRSLVMRTELPERYQSGRSGVGHVGLWMDDRTKAAALVDLETLVNLHGHNIKFLDFWNQLGEMTMEDKEGKKSWGTRDYKKHNDDLVIAILIAKINADTVTQRPVKVGTAEAPTTKSRMVYDHEYTPMGVRLVQRMETYEVKYGR